MSKTLILILAAGLMLMTSGCGNSKSGDGKTVSSDLVTNPISASSKATAGSLPVMEFETTKHDFSMMMQGEKLSYTFVFTNTGGSDLIISDASSTCGCTIPEFSKSPVKPGEKGKVEVVFNSAGKTGTVVKTVKLLTNAQPNTVELEISAEVYVPDSKK